jgi:hypothetical protein
MIAAPLHDAVVAGFVHATEHRWRDALERPARCWSRTPVQRAVDVVRADPTQPFTPTTLARLTGASPRTLHDGFRRHLDTTPMAYVRVVRLERAHADLRALGAGRDHRGRGRPPLGLRPRQPVLPGVPPGLRPRAGGDAARALSQARPSANGPVRDHRPG